MVSVSASDFKAVLDPASDLDNSTVEPILDLAIDALNIFGTEITNMSGDSGSKTVTLTSAQRGAVFLIARHIFYSFYKDIEAVNVGGGPVVTTTDLMSKPETWTIIKEAAKALIEEADEAAGIPFYVAEATS